MTTAALPPPSSIADYAIIGDCRTAALVSRDGAIDWLCLPHFSAPSVFGRLLDADAGTCLVRPTASYAVRRSYRPGTAVLETAFATEAGELRLEDVVPVLEGIDPMRPQHELLRVVESTASVPYEILIAPRPRYAGVTPRLHRRGKLGWIYSWNNEILVVRSNIELAADGLALRATATAVPGARAYLSLSYTRRDPALFPLLDDDADLRLNDTAAWWQSWIAGCTYDGPYRDAVIRSIVTLRMLAYTTSGAIVAAPTTSLPEAIGGGRNWDYRYCWLRDAGLTVQALVATGFQADAGGYLAWLLHATRLTWPKLQVVYDLYGRVSLPERELTSFRGFKSSRPVRIGNGAADQLQLDVYGEVILAAHTIVCAGGALDAVEARMLKGLGDTVCALWREPDSGIWEIRGGRRHYTFSKLMCWVALDRLLALDTRRSLDLGKRRARFEKGRAAIAEAIEQRGFNAELGSYTSELDGSTVSAELLLMSATGFKSPLDARMAGTFACIRRRLEQGVLMHRYEPGFDGLDSAEGAFGICSFWVVQHFAERGEIAEAERRLEMLLAYANDVGLFAEEIHFQSGAPLGNFPQAFTHVGLINAALAIEHARKQRKP